MGEFGGQKNEHFSKYFTIWRNLVLSISPQNFNTLLPSLLRKSTCVCPLSHCALMLIYILQFIIPIYQRWVKNLNWYMIYIYCFRCHCYFRRFCAILQFDQRADSNSNIEHGSCRGNEKVKHWFFSRKATLGLALSIRPFVRLFVR